MLDLEPIKAREVAATEGPWESVGQTAEGVPAVILDVSREVMFWAAYRQGNLQPDRDAEFASHARSDIPALIAEVERLRGEDRSSEKRAR